MKRTLNWMVLAAFIGVPIAAQAAPKTFVYCSEGSPSSFNPQLATDGTSFNASSRPLYNRLVEFKYGETTLAPALADKWDISADKTTYTFHLHPGVKWHTTENFKPSRDFNADDVLFSIDRQRLADHPFHKVSGGTYEYFDSMDMSKVIKDVKKKNDLIVVITLNHPEAPFLANMAMDFASILSAEYAGKMMAAKTPEKVDTDPVGTGPFLLTKYAKDNQIRFKANPDYFRGKAKVDQLIFSITPDPSVRFQKLKAGECHLVTEPAPADLPAMKADAQLKLMSAPGLNVAYLAFNTKKAPFTNLEVRRAFNLAINRKALIDAIYLGNAVVAKNPMPPTMWGYNNSIQDFEYNPKKAAEMLKKSGFSFDKVYDLWTMPVSRPYNPNGKKMGELMQADLSKVGVKIRLVTYDWPTYLAKSKDSDAFDLLQMGWTGDNGDPDNFLNVLLSCPAVEAGGNRARWCDKSFDDLMQKARKNPKQSERAQLYAKAQQIFHDQAPWVTIAHSTVHRVMSNRVTGYKIDPFGGDVFHEVDLK